MSGHYERRRVKLDDGTFSWERVWVKDPVTSGTSGANGSNGATGGAAAGDKLTPLTADQKRQIEISLKRAYNALFASGSKRALPDGLLALALKERGVPDVSRWLRLNTPKLYLKTTQAIERRDYAQRQIDAIFGEDTKLKNAIMTRWLLSDPGRNMANAWDQYLDTKVVNTAAFRQLYPGWKDFYARVGGDYANAIGKYNEYKANYLGWYRSIVNDVTAEIPPALVGTMLGLGIFDAAGFEAWVKQNDPAYGAGLLRTDEAKSKGEEFDDFWYAVYGEDSTPDGLLRTAYQKTNTATDFTAFFNNFIRNTDKFKSQVPGFEKWAAAQWGNADDLPGDTLHVNPMDYFKDKQSLEQYYEVLSETPGARNDALVQKALDNNWSVARFELEFKKTDPAYTKTAVYKAKGDSIDAYWKSILGIDSEPPQSIRDAFAQGSSDDETSMFDQIKKTAEFQAQYGNWGDFAGSMDAMGMSGAILRNPALYKEYRAQFYQAFANVGIAPPADFERMFFKSGVDPGEIDQNLQTYISAVESTQWQTGEQADLATASGIGDKVAGGALRLRMEKAWEAHRVYASSTFKPTQTGRTQGSGFITQEI